MINLKLNLEMIQFKDTQLVHEVGRRENNEDAAGYLDQSFYVLSDGVLEAWSDEDLSALAFSAPNPASFASRLKAECALHSKDNFTALVFEVAKAPSPL